MTAKELIALLREYPEDKIVVVAVGDDIVDITGIYDWNKDDKTSESPIELTLG
jgi:hypothetical protein